MNYEEILKYAQDSPGLRAVREIENQAKSFRGAVDISRRKGEAPEYTDNDIIRPGRAAVSETDAGHRAKIRAGIEKRKAVTEAKCRALLFDNNKDRPFDLQLIRDRFAAMSTKEIELEGVRYTRGESDLFDPAAVNILLAALKGINNNLFEQCRKSALEQRYDEPWLKLQSAEDRESEKILDSGMIPVVVDRGHGPEVIAINPATIIKSIR